jgi:TPR repeat protein
MIFALRVGALTLALFLALLSPSAQALQSPSQPSRAPSSGTQAPSQAKEEEIAELKQRAGAGDARAQVQVGLAYLTGDGVAGDDAEAVKWFRKAADQDDPDGERYLAEMYVSGRGVPADNAEAAKWLRLAAAQGDARSEHNLAVMYLQGMGVPKNTTEAAKWMRKAADQGLPEGEFGLGVIYANGYGVFPDDAEAVKWYRKAADQGHLDALSNLAGLLATSKQSGVRNVQEAIALATKAVAAQNNSIYLDTLATAYFEAGQYQKAVDAERKAVALAPDNAAYKQALDQYIAASQSH